MQVSLTIPLTIWQILASLLGVRFRWCWNMLKAECGQNIKGPNKAVRFSARKHTSTLNHNCRAGKDYITLKTASMMPALKSLQRGPAAKNTFMGIYPYTNCAKRKMMKIRWANSLEDVAVLMPILISCISSVTEDRWAFFGAEQMPWLNA